MTVAKLKELIAELPDDMQVQVVKIPEELDEEYRTMPINEVTTHSVENDDGEEIEILVIAF